MSFLQDVACYALNWLIALLYIAFLALPVTWIWNGTVANCFISVQTLSYWEICRLLVLSALIVQALWAPKSIF